MELYSTNVQTFRVTYTVKGETFNERGYTRAGVDDLLRYIVKVGGVGSAWPENESEPLTSAELDVICGEMPDWML